MRENYPDQNICRHIASPRHPCHIDPRARGTRIGDQIRKIVLHADNTDMTPMTELLLYARASRAQHVQQVFPPICATAFMWCATVTATLQWRIRGLDGI